LEGHVLQPLIMGRAVAIHPLAVIVGIAAGVVLAGIVGALVAVPIIAVLNTAVRFLVLKRREPPPEAVVVASEATLNTRSLSHPGPYAGASGRYPVAHVR
jgi:predicted PurR-regulated permease PerM